MHCWQNLYSNPSIHVNYLLLVLYAPNAFFRRKQKAMPPCNQSEVQEREPLNNQCQSELD